jgi:hypothetical protein
MPGSFSRTIPRAVGAVHKDQEEDYSVKAAQAAAVKYVARHVSRRVPNNQNRANSLGDPDGEALRLAFNGFDTSLLPDFFQRMLTTFQLGQVLDLPDGLYRAAFVRELHQPWDYISFLAVPGHQEGITRDLLLGAGYLANKKAEKLRKNLLDVVLLLLDERSMISSKILGKMELRAKICAQGGFATSNGLIIVGLYNN